MQPEFLDSSTFSGRVDTAAGWVRLLAGLLAVFALFQLLGHVLGSDRGQSGIIIALAVVGATLLVERIVFRQHAALAARSVGLGRPKVRALGVAAAASVALLLVVFVFGAMAPVSTVFANEWGWSLPGLFAQAGIAEEVLFRGYLFGRLRRGRSSRRAAGLSMVPFACVHLLLFSRSIR